MNNVFSGVKVLELASVLAGPSVGQFFAESGAEVIKVENPKTLGDVTRSWKLKGEETGDISAYFSSVNWGKQSIAIDYSKKEGLKLLYKLIKRADIVIVSFKPGDAEKLQLAYEDLVKVNPDIIYGAITGYGPHDPRVGYDAVIQAESGFMSINGEPTGEPTKLPVALMDILAGHHLKEALLLAYIQKLKTGEGQEVSVSLIDAAISSLANQGTNWLVGNTEPKRSGSLHPNIAPYGEMFETADNKKILLAVGTDRQFNELCNSLCVQPGENFKSNQQRVANREELHDKLNEVIRAMNSKDILSALQSNHIPGGIINSIPDALNLYNDMLISSDSFKGIRTFAAKMGKIEKSPHFLPPPHFNENSEAILKGVLGLKVTEIADLRAEKVII